MSVKRNSLTLLTKSRILSLDVSANARLPQLNLYSGTSVCKVFVCSRYLKTSSSVGIEPLKHPIVNVHSNKCLDV